MALETINVQFPDVALPRDVMALLDEAGDRIERHRNQGGIASPGFVPSDYPRVYAALVGLQNQGLATGDRLCEWGSGFGVVAMMAAGLGFEVSGIEIDADLVEEAEALAEDFESEVTFVCGSIVPVGDGDIHDMTGDCDWLVAGGADGYQELGMDIEDFDVIYAFPWPGEEHAFDALFDRAAAVGALLVTYHGMNDVKVQRKIG